MNEMDNNANKPNKPSKVGGYLTVGGIVFCTMGALKLTRGIIGWFAAEGDARYSDNLVIGGILLTIGIVLAGAGFALKKAARGTKAK